MADGRPVDGKGVGRKVLDRVHETNKHEFTVVLEDVTSNRNNGNASPENEDRKTMCRQYQSKTFKVELSFTAKIPMQAIAQALRGCLRVRQSFFHNDVKNSADVASGVLDCKGMAQFVSNFAEPTDPEYAPPIQKGETPGQKKAIIHQLRLEEGAKKAAEELEKYDPNSDPNISGDPYKTLFVARLNYETTESRIKREFEAYGPIKRVGFVEYPVMGLKVIAFCFGGSRGLGYGSKRVNYSTMFVTALGLQGEINGLVRLSLSSFNGEEVDDDGPSKEGEAQNKVE
ncbi:hypothetical protein M8C21_017588 [Ambrosia artemisiifolia]|uniref:U1 small nuclear ribonucleoprotein of 70kDa N-terminal domain-containing protein n=1 Tax=Ambrosia artemisiifolia TaxID=4212 RepID=A0AAD5CTX7_AMBAR|nr:hypothetical protein M8C21_017588 [Ambrosia artemisiifolia]